MDDFFSSIHEECGVVGLSLQNDNDVAAYAYYALYALQHRGQQSAGIAVNDDGVITAHCDEGLVNDVFDESTLASLGTGRMAVGMYATPPPATTGASTASPWSLTTSREAWCLRTTEI